MKLKPGLIFELAAQAQLDIPEHGAKRRIRCPFHDDHRPSAFLSEDNVFYCSVCTHDGGWTAKRFAEELGVSWCATRPWSSSSRRSRSASQQHQFSPAESQRVWRIARGRARDDDAAAADADVYDYLRSRGLSESWECPGIGIVSKGMDLPPAVRSWPTTDHRLVLPLCDHAGRIVALQARRINTGEPKVLFPAGATVKGTVFANGPGVALLRGRLRPPCTVLFGEGLTDYLALACAAAGYAVLSAPGTAFAVPAVGRWATGARVVVAVDNDEPGLRCADELVLALYRQGARDVYRAVWPRGCNDACEMVAQVGIAGLEDFIEQQMREVRSA